MSLGYRNLLYLFNFACFIFQIFYIKFRSIFHIFAPFDCLISPGVTSLAKFQSVVYIPVFGIFL